MATGSVVSSDLSNRAKYGLAKKSKPKEPVMAKKPKPRKPTKKGY